MKILRHILVASALAALAACSGGAATTVNPTTAPPAVADYTGPAPSTADVQSFRINLWDNIKANNRCGGCHNATGQTPRFARNDDVNLAYADANTIVNLTQPDQSRMVLKVGGGHNCWLSSNSACADILTTWIRNWAGSVAGGGTQIALQAPNDVDVGSSRTFPDTANDGGANSFASTIWPLVRGAGNCLRCHSPTAATPQSPFFASADVNEAYAAARAKIDLDTPANSRFVVRLGEESHNCWTTSCSNDAATMLARINQFVSGIQVQPVDPNLVLSKALTLYDGTVAAGGNRYETSTIAKYEFKTGTGSTIFDTSGVEPALNLNMSGDISWMGGWGVNIKAGGKAQGTTTGSKKLSDRIKATGEYSIEVWAAPANVTQEDAYVVSYSGGVMSRNVTLAQRAYQYEALGRSSTTGANGAPALLTRDADRDAQASLQHVVLTYDPVNGRRLYVNGNFTGDVDPRAGGSLADWDDTFALVLGNETSNNRQWLGVIRFAAVHSRALSLQKIQQNFAAGVGERYFLLFNVTQLTGVPQSYIMFEVSQYDSYSYLFTKPVFISLDPNARPGSIQIDGIRIGVNGSEAHTGQAYANVHTTVTDANYAATSGQLLSDVGTIIGLQKGPVSDQFFLTFDRIGTHTFARTPVTGVTQQPVDLAPQSDIGIRTFEQLNQSMSKITGIPTTNAAVRATYLQVQQQLPPVPSIDAFLASHQTGIAQLSIKYCSEMVNNATTRAAFFPTLNVGGPASQFAGAGKDILLVPLLQKAFQQQSNGTDLVSQPTNSDVRTELSALIDRLVTNGASSANIAKGACAAALGSGALSIL
ncbi:MAG TPA: LamG domain-containing protein [Steroidobacteraceae bacterium]|nr:LamG domain-containing protein [Steroidobacteraceae bacterium]